MAGNRLVKRIREVLGKKKKLFCAYLTLGYRSLRGTEKLIEAFEEMGVDMIEVGFPFSDPLADGVLIQEASEHALSKGVSLEDAFRMGRNLRKKKVQLPLIFFSYYNPVFHYGFERFARRLAECGFDGLLCPDLPPDEETFVPKTLRRFGLCTIYLASPTTDRKRLALITKRSSGFIYYVSLKGVTGMRKKLSGDLRSRIQWVRRSSRMPVLVGFGVADRKQAAQAGSYSDGVIVGSAIIHQIKKSGGRLGPVLKFVRSIAQVLHS